ncbi:CobG protein [Candidatus Halobonum tyrrellensis]|uniref:Ribbon-helix-helix protein, copg family n=1 Tax=Candidatus Halobonum tyrrellensis G22 TaxID=1324957 RepID=V4IV98_9EURY|nr:CobG protein [Candidatus Halobonum tyrrellensis]ESP87127.1 ribbon-helix-helix protein, copg family [Candidatus Halobonum tyrrellensis G22]
MAGELVDGLPEGLRAWVDARAEETGRSRAEVLARAVTVQRLLAEYDGPLPDASTLDAAAAGGADPQSGGDGALADRLDATDERVEAVADEFDEKLADVRDRVVQVKREADAKVDADHDHPELRRSAEAAADLADDVEAVRAAVDALDARFAEGFDNYEEVLERLTDAVDELDGKATTLASAVADLRERAADADARRSRREAAADLKREANRLGVEAAACDHCGEAVRLALLTRPACPHCDGAFDGVATASGLDGLLGRATLTAGRDGTDGRADDTGTDDAGTDTDGSGTDPVRVLGRGE